ncbi:hypothetical protein LEP1GSC186_3655 [Leptospira noguchii serovar Autumnalis str. ZUN142]|uniref:Uncharacterized protein n=1 Tax=Leptospira noguchii serovar Autumnalis str. ZUN142 TaxID=1085540 RepID=M6U1X4_9LEPT|nr:hypothetical protein LEP1GSC186_3655 [Leptospira noguchii serovar Autumnalis str. ZUN142]
MKSWIGNVKSILEFCLLKQLGLSSDLFWFQNQIQTVYKT